MNDKQSGVLAWHWVGSDLKMRDGTPIEMGHRYSIPPGQSPRLYRQGYHASVRALDALLAQPGTVVCAVRLSGEMKACETTLCAAQGQVLWFVDACQALQAFALACADQAVRAFAPVAVDHAARMLAAVDGRPDIRASAAIFNAYAETLRAFPAITDSEIAAQIADALSALNSEVHTHVRQLAGYSYQNNADATLFALGDAGVALDYAVSAVRSACYAWTDPAALACHAAFAARYANYVADAAHHQVSYLGASDRLNDDLEARLHVLAPTTGTTQNVQPVTRQPQQVALWEIGA